MGSVDDVAQIWASYVVQESAPVTKPIAAELVPIPPTLLCHQISRKHKTRNAHLDLVMSTLESSAIVPGLSRRQTLQLAKKTLWARIETTNNLPPNRVEQTS